MPTQTLPTTLPATLPTQTHRPGQTLDYGACTCCAAASGERCASWCPTRWDD